MNLDEITKNPHQDLNFHRQRAQLHWVRTGKDTILSCKSPEEFIFWVDAAEGGHWPCMIFNDEEANIVSLVFPSIPYLKVMYTRE